MFEDLADVSWPTVFIGLMVGLYWLRVMQMVARTKREVGRAANIVPPEPLGRVLRLVWGPVIVLWIFLPLVTPFFRDLPAALEPVWYSGDVFVGWIAVVVTAAAFAMTWVCWAKMGKSWRMGIDPDEKTVLVFNGPYAYVRHPIYGLSQVMMVATLFALPSPMMLIVAMLHLFLMQWEVRREEKYLVALHGVAYSDYMVRVGRFVPRIRAWK